MEFDVKHLGLECALNQQTLYLIINTGKNIRSSAAVAFHNVKIKEEEHQGEKGGKNYKRQSREYT